MLEPEIYLQMSEEMTKCVRHVQRCYHCSLMGIPVLIIPKRMDSNNSHA